MEKSDVRGSVGEHGCQTTTERAQALKSIWGASPCVIEHHLVIVIIDHVAHDRVNVVQFEQLAMFYLDLLDDFVRLDFRYVLSERVKHLIEELTMVQLDQLSGHHRRCILFRNTIGAVLLGFNRMQAGEQC
jgi:hypothetical protein